MKLSQLFVVGAAITAAILGATSAIDSRTRATQAADPGVAPAASARQPIPLVDEAQPGTDFYQFRARLRQAVSQRDASFIRQIAAPGIKLSFGNPITLDDRQINNPNALFWKQLERTIATGCAVYTATGSASESWACPHAFVIPETINAPDAYSMVIITATGVNVRDRPSLTAPMIGSVSNEVVKYNNQSPEVQSEAFRQAQETLDGWMPIVLPNGRSGFVSSRYAYSPVGYRAIFSKVNGQWQMQAFVTGD